MRGGPILQPSRIRRVISALPTNRRLNVPARVRAGVRIGLPTLAATITMLSTLSSIVFPVPAASAAEPDVAARPVRPGRLRPDRIMIPAGPFVRGSIRAIDERPVETKRLPAFRIDRTEVTRGMYARCVAAHRCPALAADQNSPDDAELPVTNVSWNDARGFCAFAGGRLPTEDEWEKAARGADGREFPWGSEASCAHANWGNFDGEGPCRTENPGRPTAVGTHPTGASPYGVQDLAGNVWEWVATSYRDEPGRRAVRGGSCCSYFVEPRAANRNGWAPEHKDADLGFRCVGL
jgi:formylglycine-generating enzyme required for sulfatase activity